MKNKNLLLILLLSAVFSAAITSRGLNLLNEQGYENGTPDDSGHNITSQQAGEIYFSEYEDNGPTPKSDYKPKWRNHNSSFYTMKSNFCQITKIAVSGQRIPGFEVCLNKDGFRDQNYSIEKPEDTVRIAALGDAVTFGLGVENDEVWPRYLEKHLERKSETDYQVLNFGIPFTGTKDEVLWMNQTGRNYDPDIVILQYMDNDAQNLTRIQRLTQRFKQDLPQNMSETRKHSIANLEAIKEERKIRKNMTPEDELETVDTYIDKLENYSEEGDFEVFIMYYTTEFTDRHLSYLNNTAREKGWGFMVSDLDTNATFGTTFYLTSEGHNRTAKQIASNLPN